MKLIKSTIFYFKEAYTDLLCKKCITCHKMPVIFTLFLFVIQISKAQQLESYIKEAEGNNPKIKAFNLKHEIAKEKENEVNSFTNTEIGLGYFLSKPETHVGSQRAHFLAKQMIPWFGTNSAKVNYRNTLADAADITTSIAKRELALSVSKSYYSLYQINEKQKILKHQVELLKTYEQVLLSSVEVGKASMVDVLQLQIRKNELKQQKEELVQDFIGEQALFNALLGRDPDSTVTIDDTISIPKEEIETVDQNVVNNPELLKYDTLVTSIEQLELINQKERSPQIGLGINYIVVSAWPNQSFKDNGKDIFMPMAFLSIPLFSKKHSSRTRQNKLQQQETMLQKEERTQYLSAFLSKAISAKNKARIKYRTQIDNLKQANNAEKILMKSYETGTVAIKSVLDIQELQLKFQSIQIESVKEYFTQLAIINYITDK